MKLLKIDKLYHGTNKDFKNFDFKYARDFKDFGKGFYLTTNRRQAQAWALRKSKNSKMAYVQEYKVEHEDVERLKILELLQYDGNWVHYLYENRILNKKDTYDIVYDKMADNKTTNIAEFLDEYSKKKIEKDEVAKRLVWKDESVDQYCFKSVEALKHLKHIKTDAVEVKEDIDE